MYSEELTGQMAIESPSFPPPVWESRGKLSCRILAWSFTEDQQERGSLHVCIRMQHARLECVSMCVYVCYLWGHHRTLFVMHILN